MSDLRAKAAWHVRRAEQLLGASTTWSHPEPATRFTTEAGANACLALYYQREADRMVGPKS